MTQTFLEAKGFAPVSPLTIAPIVPVEDDFDREHKIWLHEMGLDVELTEQQVIDIARHELSRC